MINRSRELEPDYNAAFDYEAYDEEFHDASSVNIEDPYEEYECFDVEVCEVVTKNISVFAKDKKSAKEYVSENLESINMEKDIDEYIKVVTVAEQGDSSCEMTVPLWWYDKD